MSVGAKPYAGKLNLLPHPEISLGLNLGPFHFCRQLSIPLPLWFAPSHHPECSVAPHCLPNQADTLQLDIQSVALSGLNLPLQPSLHPLCLLFKAISTRQI